GPGGAFGGVRGRLCLGGVRAAAREGGGEPEKRVGPRSRCHSIGSSARGGEPPSKQISTDLRGRDARARSVAKVRFVTYPRGLVRQLPRTPGAAATTARRKEYR